MKLNEKFVAKVIQNKFFKKYSNVSYTEGEDPPDIYLKYNSNKVAIELTELSPNLYKDSVSIDMAYEKLIKNIDIKIPDYTHWLIVFHHASIKLNRAQTREITKFLENPNDEMKICINGIFVEIKPISSNKKPGTISQISLPINSCSRDMDTVSLMDFNIEHTFQSIISKAIETKKEKCKDIKKPIWLAVHDSYFSYIFSQSKAESIELYKRTMKNIDFGIFEKIIITFKDKEIMVFGRETTQKYK